MYEIILVPLDGSHRAEAILPFVEKLARGFQSKVIFMQAVELERSAIDPVYIEPADLRQHEHEMADEALTYVKSRAGEFRAMGIQARGVVDHGTAINTILAVAEREEASLIAIASHGRTGLPRVIHGSVASGVLTRTDRPLLLVRSDGHGGARQR